SIAISIKFCNIPGINEIFLLIATIIAIKRPSTKNVSSNELVILKKPKRIIGSAANETILFILKATHSQVKKKNTSSEIFL
ncbi:MAG TPA: hypothetical protein VMR59_00555, partial [Patescibacteria group bacterium]|nr:hypothetical protein [Patescibacteria group bacterium]